MSASPQEIEQRKEPLRIVPQPKPEERKQESSVTVRREIDRLARQMGRMMVELQGLKDRV